MRCLIAFLSSVVLYILFSWIGVYVYSNPIYLIDSTVSNLMHTTVDGIIAGAVVGTLDDAIGGIIGTTMPMVVSIVDSRTIICTVQ